MCEYVCVYIHLKFNSGPTLHRFGLCSQRFVYIYHYMLKKRKCEVLISVRYSSLHQVWQAANLVITENPKIIDVRYIADLSTNHAVIDWSTNPCMKNKPSRDRNRNRNRNWTWSFEHGSDTDSRRIDLFWTFHLIAWTRLRLRHISLSSHARE